MAINPKIYPLVGNENALSLKQIESLIKRQVIERDELGSVLSDELLAQCGRYLDGEMKRSQIGTGSERVHIEKDRTEVYFWGLKGSGKSTVIASLLATEYVQVTEGQDDADIAMANDMRDAFGETGECVVMPVFCKPTDGSNISRAVNVEMSYPKSGRKHPMTFIETRASKSTILFPDALLTPSANDKIHIICYDGTRSDAYQDPEIMKLLDDLESWGVLKTSVGIYLLVTKIDANTMVPQQFRANSAQSLITAHHQDLWFALKAKCYSMNIYDATPIPFCVGDVRLQDLVTVDLTYARHLAERPLLLKSNPYRTRVEKVLGKGNKWVTMVLLCAACVGVVYGVLRLAEGIEHKPTAAIRPYNFLKDFDSRFEDEIEGKLYTSSLESLFNNLAVDLRTEEFVRANDYDPEEDEAALSERDSMLYGEFASAVCKRVEEEFEQSDWDDAFIKHMDSVLGLINVSAKYKYGEESRVKECSTTISEYYAALDLIGKSNKCKSMGDVNYVKNHKDDYNHAPLTNSDKVRSGLSGIVDRANCSYAEHLRSRASKLLGDYYSEYNWWDRYYKQNYGTPFSATRKYSSWRYGWIKKNRLGIDDVRSLLNGLRNSSPGADAMGIILEADAKLNKITN